MPNIAGIYGVSFGSETECSVASNECFPQLAVVPLFREQYRLVDNSILLLVCLGRSVEYAGPQRMHRAQRQKMKACQSLCKGIDKTHDSGRKAEPIGVFKTGCQRVR
jgi:hypothetical protein